MQFARSGGVKPTQTWWHKGRQRAREQAYSSDLDAFFSDTEIVKLDLETAQIDGSDNPRLWTFNRAIDIFGINGTDVRELKDR